MTLTELETLIWSYTIKPVRLIQIGDCIECSSHHKVHGYTRITVNSKEIPLHRFIYELLNGEVSIDLVIRHKCDNRGCCNPDHLTHGTNGDNIRDAVERSSMNKGINNGQCRLTGAQINEIKNSKERSRPLELRYGISRKTVYNIKKGVTHV